MEKRRIRKETKKEKGEIRDISVGNIRNKIISAIIISIFAICTGIVTYMVIKTNMLPNKYLIPGIVALCLILLVISLYIIRKKTKGKNKLVLYIVSIILSVIYIVVSIYCDRMTSFLKNIETSSVNLKTYYVISLKDSSYSKVSDLEKQDVGYYHNEIVDLVPVLDKFQKVVPTCNLVAHTNIDELEESLEKKETAAILIEESYKIMLEETIPNFINIEKVIYKFEIEAAAEAISKEVTSITKEPFSIYVSGIDTYGSIAAVSRSDVNMVITVNPTTNTILMTSIPRDYYVKLHGTSGNKDKLTHAGIYGIEKSVTTIEDLLDIDINYYFRVNFTSLIDIINAIGGVNVYAEEGFKTTFGKIRYTYKQGMNELNGKEALSFARERKAFNEGDRMRGVHQQAVLSAIIEKASSYTIISKFDKLLKSLENKFTTNMDHTKMQELVKYQLSEMPSWKVVTSSLDGYDSRQPTYSMGSRKLYVMVPFKDSVKDARNLLQAVLKGKATDGSYIDPNVKVPSSITSLPAAETKTPTKAPVTNVVQVPATPEVTQETPQGEKTEVVVYQ